MACPRSSGKRNKQQIRMLLLLVLCSVSAGSVAQSNCVGNQVLWRGADGSTVCQSYTEAIAEANAFLQANMPDFDAPNEVTLFGAPGGLHGLNEGIASLGTWGP